MDALLMLPTYNERENLESLVREIVAIVPDLNILIIDDSSPDGTGEIADGLAREFHRVKVMHRPPKSGRGTCSLDGYKYAINNDFSHYLEMDVDHSHPPSELPKILKEAGLADLVVGSRFLKGGGVEGWNFKRHALHFLADLSVRIILGTPTTDHTNGFRCYSVDCLKKIDFTKLPAGGYVAHTILENVFYRAGFVIKEIPSVFRDRVKGSSKMSGHEAINGIKDMLKFRWIRIIKGSAYFLNK